jgi:hypothetical protein
MKKITLMMICLLGLREVGFGQFRDALIPTLVDPISGDSISKAPLNHIVTLINVTNNTGIRKGSTNEGPLLTERSLNTFFINRLSYFFSGKEDVGFFKSFAFLNTTDGILTIGQNISNTKVDNPEKRLSSIFSYSIKAKITDNYAGIFSSKQLENSLGFSLKYTYTGRAIIYYSNAQKLNMDNYRASVYSDIQKKLLKEARGLHKDMEAHKVFISDVGFLVTEKKKYETALRKKYLNEFYDKEYEKLTENENYNAYSQWWITGGLYIPVTANQNIVSKSLLAKADTFNFRPWDMNATFNYSCGTAKSSNLFQISAGVMKTNNMKDSIKKQSYSTIKFLNPVIIKNDTIFKNNGVLNITEKNKDVQVGNYDEFWGYYFKLRALFYPECWDKETVKIGLNTFIDYQKLGKTDFLDVGIGIPISTRGKEKNSLVNFEVIFKLEDINNTSKRLEDMFKVGLAVGLPIERFKF